MCWLEREKCIGPCGFKCTASFEVVVSGDAVFSDGVYEYHQLYGWHQRHYCGICTRHADSSIAAEQGIRIYRGILPYCGYYRGILLLI